MTKAEAQAKLEALIQSKVDAQVEPIKAELTKSRRERVEWFYAGYDAGMQDNPEDVNASGKPFDLGQRKIRAAATFAIDLNKSK